MHAERSDSQRSEALTQIDVPPSEESWTRKLGGEEKGRTEGYTERQTFCLCLCSKSPFLQLLLREQLDAGAVRSLVSLCYPPPRLLMAKQLQLVSDSLKKFHLLLRHLSLRS